jgi:hypothetical protein
VYKCIYVIKHIQSIPASIYVPKTKLQSLCGHFHAWCLRALFIIHGMELKDPIKNSNLCFFFNIVQTFISFYIIPTQYWKDLISFSTMRLRLIFLLFVKLSKSNIQMYIHIHTHTHMNIYTNLSLFLFSYVVQIFV